MSFGAQIVLFCWVCTWEGSHGAVSSDVQLYSFSKAFPHLPLHGQCVRVLLLRALVST